MMSPADKDSEGTLREHSTSDLDDVMLAEENTAGVIKVHNDVVANIVRIATQEVPGVASIGGGSRFREELAGIFSKRDSTSGIMVAENEDGHYVISVKVILHFGVELAKVGEDIQIAVREQVAKMTNKKVARVDVLIDGVRIPEKERRDADEFDHD